MDSLTTSATDSLPAELTAMVLNVLFGENIASTWLYLLTDNFLRCPQNLIKLKVAVG